MTVSYRTPLINTRTQRKRIHLIDAPLRLVGGVEIQHDTVPPVAGAVKHEPFRAFRRSGDNAVAFREALGDIPNGVCGEVGFLTSPVEEPVQDAQLSPKNMSESAPTWMLAGSQ